MATPPRLQKPTCPCASALSTTTSAERAQQQHPQQDDVPCFCAHGSNPLFYTCGAPITNRHTHPSVSDDQLSEADLAARRRLTQWGPENMDGHYGDAFRLMFPDYDGRPYAVKVNPAKTLTANADDAHQLATPPSMSADYVVGSSHSPWVRFIRVNPQSQSKPSSSHSA